MLEQVKDQGDMTVVDVLVVLAENWIWFVLGAFAALALSYGYIQIVPRLYTSSAVLRSTELDIVGNESQLANIAAYITSNRVLDDVVKKYPTPGRSADADRKSLLARLRVAPSKGFDKKNSDLLVVEFDDADPKRAQDIVLMLIDLVLQSMKPRKSEKEWIAKQLEVASTQLENLDRILGGVAMESPRLVPDKLTDSGISLLKFRQERTEVELRLLKYRRQLEGPTQEAMVLFAPSLPTEPSSSKLLWIVAQAEGATMFLLLLYFFAREVIRRGGQKSAMNIARLRRAFRREPRFIE